MDIPAQDQLQHQAWNFGRITAQAQAHADMLLEHYDLVAVYVLPALPTFPIGTPQAASRAHRNGCFQAAALSGWGVKSH